MDPVTSAIAGSIVGAASAATVAGISLVVGNTGSVSMKNVLEHSVMSLASSSSLGEVMGNTGSVSMKNVLEGSVMSLASSSCPDEEIDNTGSISRKKVLEASVMSLATSSCLDERKFVSLKFLFTKSIPGHGEIFEEVSRGSLQPGDILLFPLDGSNSAIAQALLRHAAVFCGNGEVIHFQGIDCNKNPGVISKEGLVKMQKNRGSFDVYRKKDGVVLEEFYNRVRIAMNSEAKYDPYTNNCIHFALSLLGLLEFYSELVEVQDEGDNSCSDTATSSPPSLAGQGSSHTA